MNIGDQYSYTIEKISSKPGYWNTLKVQIFDASGKRIGEYERNYSDMYRTFLPFEMNGKHYALYSPDYTATRVKIVQYTSLW